MLKKVRISTVSELPIALLIADQRQSGVIRADQRSILGSVDRQ